MQNKTGNESPKKGLLDFLLGGKKKSSCCGAVELEEIPDENAESNTTAKNEKKTSCCG